MDRAEKEIRDIARAEAGTNGQMQNQYLLELIDAARKQANTLADMLSDAVADINTAQARVPEGTSLLSIRRYNDVLAYHRQLREQWSEASRERTRLDDWALAPCPTHRRRWHHEAYAGTIGPEWDAIWEVYCDDGYRIGVRRVRTIFGPRGGVKWKEVEARWARP